MPKKLDAFRKAKKKKDLQHRLASDDNLLGIGIGLKEVANQSTGKLV